MSYAPSWTLQLSFRAKFIGRNFIRDKSYNLVSLSKEVYLLRILPNWLSRNAKSIFKMIYLAHALTNKTHYYAPQVHFIKFSCINCL